MKLLRVSTILAALFVTAGVSLSSPASAQVLIEEFYTFLGPRDHFNSNGERLTLPWQIIRQDRANYHRFGIRDPGDEWDSFFASAENRERMETMLMNGDIAPAAANAIVNGSVWIRVQIYGFGNTGQFVRVFVE